jgi:rhamnosyl/mannosyltransferase
VTSGVANSVGRVAEGLRERGHDVVYLSSADAWRCYLGEFRLSTLAVRWARLRSLVAGYDLVHLTGPAPFIADALLARWRLARHELPTLVYTHGFTLELDGFRFLSRIYGRVLYRLARVADAVVVTTPSYRELVRRGLGCGDEVPVNVIPWAGDLPVVERPVSALYNGARPLRVLSVGQQRPYKGVHLLIEAVAGVDGVELTIVGDGPMRARYQAMIAALGATNVVHRGPAASDTLTSLYDGHDVLCLPSTNRSEAFGLVQLDAMSRGCAVVAAAHPGVTDVAGEAGVFVPPGDGAHLRAVLQMLAMDAPRTAALQRCAPGVARRYSWPATVDAYEGLYRSLLERRSSSS